MVGRILEITFVLILVFLIANNARGVTQVIGATGKVYTESVRALQAR